MAVVDQQTYQYPLSVTVLYLLVSSSFHHPPSCVCHTTAYLYVQAVVSPEYPVAAGLTVKLHCSVETNMPQVSWNWVYLTKTGWQNVGNTMDLSLTEPNQTGTYCCYASATGIKQKSSNTVTAYIVAMQPTGMWSFLICCIS